MDLPPRHYEDNSKPLKRMSYIAELEKAWWHQHKVQDFPSLMPTPKWTESRRNMREGDITLIKYSSVSKTGEYRLGRVVLVEIDEDQFTITFT